MIEHLKRVGLGLACLGAFCTIATAAMLVWELCMTWIIPSAIVLVVLLCWTIGTMCRTA